MLQIISKKFFESEDYYETNREAIVYSNIYKDISIITSIIDLNLIETFDGVSTYLMTYKNRIEKKTPLVAIGDDVIINDFLSCCTFWFNGVFSTDKYYIQNLIRIKKNSIVENELPSNIIPDIFKINKKIDVSLIGDFGMFFDKLLKLKREKYDQVIRIIRQYQDGLYMINSNLDLSYTMFVASIESLVQKFDNFKSEWEDCPDKVVKSMEDVFSGMDEKKVEEIKKIIIDETHNKLSSRYEGFCLKHINQEFYLNEAIGVENPVRKSQINKSIKNSYVLRSKYVHTLKEMPNMIALIGSSETIMIGKETYFTFSGITRFCRHIINSFIDECEKVDKESFNYFEKLPRTYKGILSPELWLADPNTLKLSTSNHYMNSFLNYFLEKTTKKMPLHNLTLVCNKIEKLIQGLNNKEIKSKLLLVYFIYNYFIEEKAMAENWMKIIEENNDVFENICLTNLVIYILISKKFEWKTEEVIWCYNEYNRKRFWRNEMKMPQIIEVCILLEISNMLIGENDNKRAIEYREKAVMEKPGDKVLIELIKTYNIEMFDWKEVYLHNL